MAAGPEFITNIFVNNKQSLILFGVVLIIILILKWIQMAKEKLDRIN